MRRISCLAALAAVVAALGLMAAESADAKGRNCARPNTVTLASTSVARVWRPRGALSYRLYGCLKSLDRAYRLDRNTGRPAYWAYGSKPSRQPFETPGQSRWYFAGRFIGVWARHLATSELWIYSLRSGRMAVRVGNFWGTPEGGIAWGPRVATNGVPVWIAYAGDEGLYTDEVSACRDLGGSAWSDPCGWYSVDMRHNYPITLGAGAHDTLADLTVSGITARWRANGAARSRSLAPLGQ